jgi:uncharacterized membrane protein
MQTAGRFLRVFKATMIGGVFVLVPFVLLVYVMAEALAVATSTIRPLLEWLPIKSVGGVSLAFVVAVAAVILLCFLAGLVAHTAIAKWLVRAVESAILSNLPGYSLVKSMGEGVVGRASGEGRTAVLVKFDDSSQIGFLMDRLPDGSLVVFVPNVPSPWSGRLHIMEPGRVKVLTIPIRDVVEKVQRMGIGLGSSLAEATRTH